jgi:multidrug efflux pump subunit AcrA (membrane-fusion protein)
MDLQDLTKLKIERAAQPARRRRPWGKIAAIVVVVAAAAAFALTRFAGSVPVETVAVSTVYPSLNFTLLNATGYVVPQRKAALSSKATGRLEWLGVLEGSRVKAGDVIARLESNDVKAKLAQAEAQVNVAIANQQQGAAELKDAEANFRRSAELCRRNSSPARSMTPTRRVLARRARPSRRRRPRSPPPRRTAAAPRSRSSRR